MKYLTAKQRESRQQLSKPRMGEVTMKAFLIDEAQRLGISPGGVNMRIQRGKYPGLLRRWVTLRTVLVTQVY